MQHFQRPADLTAFLRALKLGAVPDRGYGVSVDDIALVESAWRNPGNVVSTYSWVLALKNGRRLYLKYTLDGMGPGAEEELEIATLHPEQPYPALEGDAGVFWYRPDHINQHLGLRGPRLH
jgi:hypothetical protein